MTMPAGTYYVGDLCYVMHDDWDEFCDITLNENDSSDGEFALKDGRRFASYGTMYGDGEYHDQDGNRYFVDAGLIGCIRVEDMDADLRTSKGDFGGRIVEFKEPFETYSEEGLICIGHIEIDTKW